jgi:hypothetical protein
MERFEQLTHEQERSESRAMRLFDIDDVPCTLDGIGHRVEKQKHGHDQKVIDLTLRIEPFTSDLATAVDPVVRQLLFTVQNVRPKSLIHLVELNYAVPRQRLTVTWSREITGSAIVFTDTKIHRLRAKLPNDADDYAFLFMVTVADIGSQQLDYLHTWLTDVRFVTFTEELPALDLGDDEPNDDQPYAH